jgi:hypothetical protein
MITIKSSPNTGKTLYALVRAIQFASATSERRTSTIWVYGELTAESLQIRLEMLYPNECKDNTMPASIKYVEAPAVLSMDYLFTECVKWGSHDIVLLDSTLSTQMTPDVKQTALDGLESQTSAAIFYTEQLNRCDGMNTIKYTGQYTHGDFTWDVHVDYMTHYIKLQRG